MDNNESLVEEQLRLLKNELKGMERSLLYHLTECGNVGRALNVAADIFDLKLKINSLEACKLTEARKKLFANTER